MLTPDIDSLVPHVPFNRRTFLKATIGSGFAAAVLPVSAQTIHTDSAGLEAGKAEFDSQGTKVPAYRAQPRDKRHLPIVIVIHEIFGVHEHIADVCRRFAKAGYLALAPNLYSRQGDPSAYPSIQQLNDEIVSKVSDASVMADLDAAIQWAGAHGGDLNRVGAVGFCWGGRQAWLFAEHNARLKAAVAFYGRVVGQSNERMPFNPVDRVADLHAPVLGLYGGQDTSIAQDTLDRMKTLVSRGPEAARGSQIVVYPDAGHAFFADYRPSYRKADAEDAWRRTLDWLKSHGVA